MVKLLERSKDNVLGFEVSGVVSESEFLDAAAGMDEAIKKFGKIRNDIFNSPILVKTKSNYRRRK